MIYHDKNGHDSGRKLNYFMVPVVLVAADLLVVYGTMIGSVFLAEKVLGEPLCLPATWSVLLPVLYMSNLLFADLYRTRRVLTDYARKIFRASAAAVLTIIVFDFLMHLGYMPLSRVFLLFFWFFSFWGLYVERCLLKCFFDRLGVWRRQVIVVGAGRTAERFVKAFGSNFDIIGFIEDDASKPLLQAYPRLGGFADVEQVLRRHPVYDVVLAIPGLSKGEIVNLFYRVQPFVKQVSLIPDLFGIPVGNLKVLRSFDDQLLVLQTRNNLNRLSNRLLKRLFDLIVGSMIAVVIMPILFAVYVMIKLDSDGPAFYNAERIGKNGKLFRCYKFRSMYVDADRILLDFLDQHPAAKEEWRAFQKLRGEDPRVTKVGRFIRKYSMDELPQIFNVLQGNMSLVGPRPYLPREKETMGKYLPVIAMTMPGMTGLWQVSGRSNVTFSGRLKLDSWYVRNWNLWQDIVILFKTVKVVLGRDAY